MKGSAIDSPPPGRAASPESKPVSRLKFNENRDFQKTLRQRIDAFFQETGRRKRDCWQMYLKTAVVLTLSTTVYVALVFFTHDLWQGLALAIAVGLTTALIGFNIQHDAGHGAYSNRPGINMLMALTMDMIGGSSHVWHVKHGVVHHTYVNITGWDNDIAAGVLGRLSPHQKRRWFHRFQHWYFWLLYGLIAIRWQLADDFRTVITGRQGRHLFPRPKGGNLARFILGKLLFFSIAFGIPMFFHAWWAVVFYYAVAAITLGATLGIVFQLPHCVEAAAFPLPLPGTTTMELPWAVHQAEVTLDFAQKNPVLTYFLGGLNFHLEHHLFPMICHINYPAMSGIVAATCREFGVRYQAHPTFLSGVAAHYRWLKKMGRPLQPVPLPGS
ncbi:MAG: acyl-CoA desaturase [Chitinispirillaceae bacterium]|nr:acyl-CoA desaturase [Chitinispirillaceae bacterium]